MDESFIRNFAIIAHIDHGKSTLADRLLELTGTVPKREMQEQILDSNPIERERGITIKLAPVRMSYQSSAISRQRAESRKLMAESYVLNLIDTPGHVDFSYEVSRSLAACEGALLVVDATQGVQAQTLANLAQARKHNLAIIPIINKIDLPNARIETCLEELSGLRFSKDEVLRVSAKTGENVEKVLEAIVERIPPPQGEPAEPLRALVFSSQYDSHKGVVVFVRVVDGSLRRLLQGDPLKKASWQPIYFLASGVEITPVEIGYFSPKMTPCDILRTGEVGYIATGLKDARLAKVGDTITTMPNDKCQMLNEKQKFRIGHWPFSITPLAGYQEPKPMVFLGLFPINSDDLAQAREAMERLRLSDSAFTFRLISSLALGHGFHCGFLGLLHAEIVQERLSREFNLNMIATAPSVEYRIKLAFSRQLSVIRQSEGRKLKADSFLSIQSASEFPDPSLIEEVREPVMSVTIYSPKRFVGPVMQLAQEKRGVYVDLKYMAEQAELTYLVPLSEMIVDFFDRLKSITEGYASLDYEFYDYQLVELVKLDILVNKEKVDALSLLVVAKAAQRRGREMVEKLAGVIPRQQFQIPIQAAIGGSPRSGSGAAGQIIARADVKAFRKDVTQKLYGGDRTRKDKLLEAQKKGKARLKLIGKVAIPQSAFFEALKKS